MVYDKKTHSGGRKPIVRTREWAEELIEEYMGNSYRTMAKKRGVSSTTVFKWVIQAKEILGIEDIEHEYTKS